MHEAHDALTCIGSKSYMLMKKIELNIATNIILNQMKKCQNYFLIFQKL